MKLFGIMAAAMLVAPAFADDTKVDVCADLKKDKDAFEKLAGQVAYKMGSVTKGKNAIPGISAFSIGACPANWEKRVLVKPSADVGASKCGVKVVFDADEGRALRALASLKALSGGAGLKIEVKKDNKPFTLDLCAETGAPRTVALAAMSDEGLDEATERALGGFVGNYTPVSAVLTINTAFPLNLTVPSFGRFMNSIQVKQQGNCQIHMLKVQSNELLDPTRQEPDGTWTVNGGQGAQVFNVVLSVSGFCQLQVKAR